ncbi:hypothetical protein Slin15195_G110580 [Septoria linicola]|uniref:Uncharacterized protein n=1 Tax=Septoria linicola TaxID=215465 RepID=A0A9Q9AYH1_9PEZI|nr:hypothetical protein Slin15195_G110580 [Septoria linicola]
MQIARTILLLGTLTCAAVADISNKTATTFAHGIYNTNNVTLSTATTVPEASLTISDGERAAVTPAGLICHDDRKPYPCFGIERRLAIEAIDWFCGVYHDHVFDIPFNNVGGTYYYASSNAGPEPKGVFNTLADQGKITVTISILDDKCAPVVVMSQEACRQWLRIPIDQCDIEGVSNKHGGYIDHGCLRYEFQPNPIYWPSCGYKHCSVSGQTCYVDGNEFAPLSALAM